MLNLKSFDGICGISAVLHLTDFLSEAGKQFGWYPEPLLRLQAYIAAFYSTAAAGSVFDAWCEQHLAPILDELRCCRLLTAEQLDALYVQQYAAWQAVQSAYKQQFCHFNVHEFMQLVQSVDYDPQTPADFMLLIKVVNRCRRVLATISNCPVTVSHAVSYFLAQLDSRVHVQLAASLMQQAQHDVLLQQQPVCPLRVLSHALYCIAFEQQFEPMRPAFCSESATGSSRVDSSAAAEDSTAASADTAASMQHELCSIDDSRVTAADAPCSSSPVHVQKQLHSSNCNCGLGSSLESQLPMTNVPQLSPAVTNFVDHVPLPHSKMLQPLAVSFLVVSTVSIGMHLLHMCFVVMCAACRSPLIDASIRAALLACPAVKGVDFSPGLLALSV